MCQSELSFVNVDGRSSGLGIFLAVAELVLSRDNASLLLLSLPDLS